MDAWLSHRCLQYPYTKSKSNPNQSCLEHISTRNKRTMKFEISLVLHRFYSHVSNNLYLPHYSSIFRFSHKWERIPRFNLVITSTTLYIYLYGTLSHMLSLNCQAINFFHCYNFILLCQKSRVSLVTGALYQFIFKVEFSIGTETSQL